MQRFQLPKHAQSRYTALGLALCLSLAGTSHAQSIQDQINTLRVELIQARIDKQDERAKTLEQQLDALQMQARQNADFAQGGSAADYNALATSALQQEQYALALQYYQKVLLINKAQREKSNLNKREELKARYSPMDAMTYASVGEVQLKLGNKAQALKAYSYAADTMKQSIIEMTALLDKLQGAGKGKSNRNIQALEQEYVRLVKRGQEISQGESNQEQGSAPESNPNPLDPSLLTQYAGPKAQ